MRNKIVVHRHSSQAKESHRLCINATYRFFEYSIRSQDQNFVSSFHFDYDYWLLLIWFYIYIYIDLISVLLIITIKIGSEIIEACDEKVNLTMTRNIMTTIWWVIHNTMQNTIISKHNDRTLWPENIAVRTLLPQDVRVCCNEKQQGPIWPIAIYCCCDKKTSLQTVLNNVTKIQCCCEHR